MNVLGHERIDAFYNANLVLPNLGAIFLNRDHGAVGRG